MRHWMLALLLSLATGPVIAADQLVILSPHRKSIQQEFVPAFEKYYKETYKTDVHVDWLDQGGTSDDVRFVRAKFAANPKTSGVDIFWGGGTATFIELAADGLLAKHELPAELKKEVPERAAGIALYGKNHDWYASAMSSFGIFYNKKLLKFEGLTAPKTWEDLADPKYVGNISLTDPRHSGSANSMNTIVLESKGWDRGWELLTGIAANARSFTHSSSDPIKAVVSGDAVAAMAIDFYALAKIGDLGRDNLGFELPAGQTVLDPDPIAILKGAPHREVAERFVNWVLSAEAQKLLVLPKGAKDGPRLASLGRMAVNTKTYDLTKGARMVEVNPFDQKESLVIDMDKAAKLKRIFNDLVGALLVDTHGELTRAWRAQIKKGLKPEDLKELAKTPVTEKELLELSTKWNDDVFRNKVINEWVTFAKAKYEKLGRS